MGVTTFTSEDRIAAQKEQLEPIPFAGMIDLTIFSQQSLHTFEPVPNPHDIQQNKTDLEK